MRLNTRDELVKIWKGWMALAGRGATDFWKDQRNERNSVIDAEALLCFLLPQTEIESLRYTDHRTHRDEDLWSSMTKTFEGRPADGLGRLITDYFEAYRDPEREAGNRCDFSGGGYVERDGQPLPSHDEVPGAAAPAVVDSYSLSATLCTQVLLLLGEWQRNYEGRRDEWETLRDLSSERLTEALQGLLASFSVSTMEPELWKRTGHEWPERDPMIQDLRQRLQGMGWTVPRGDAFECGWSWGVIRPDENPLVEDDHGMSAGVTDDGPYYAENAPYLYFTVTAMDGIVDLFSNRVQASNILTDEQGDERVREQADKQARLATRLRTVWEITRRYWAALAFHEEAGRWQIENMPWVTSDGEENASEYWNLYLLRIVGGDIPAGEHNLERIIAILEELAQRGRITRKPYPAADDDYLPKLHYPGFTLPLVTDDEQTDDFEWAIYDFSAQLLKRCGDLQVLAIEPQLRARLVRLIDDCWSQHLAKRATREQDPVWDDLAKVYGPFVEKHGSPTEKHPDHHVPSWYMTERVVEALVAVSNGERVRPKVAEDLRRVALELVTELDWQVARLDDPKKARELRKGLAEAREKLSESPALALMLGQQQAAKILESQRSVEDAKARDL